jgi:hypothetical protein
MVSPTDEFFHFSESNNEQLFAATDERRSSAPSWQSQVLHQSHLGLWRDWDFFPLHPSFGKTIIPTNMALPKTFC